MQRPDAFGYQDATPSASTAADVFSGAENGDAVRFVQDLLDTADGQQRCFNALSRARRAYKEDLEKDADGFPQWEVRAAAPGMEDRGESLRALGHVRVLHADTERCQLPGIAILAEICFRGTTSQENMVMNLRAQAVPLTLGPGQGSIHRGFQEAYLALRPGLLENLDSALRDQARADSQTVLVRATGHSLGGALATLACYDLATSRGYRVECITWGSPRVGDRGFCVAYNDAVAGTARFTNRFDVVPRLPANEGDEDDGHLQQTLNRFLGSSQDQIGARGYMHVCSALELDAGAAGSAAHWSSAALEVVNFAAKMQAFMKKRTPGTESSRTSTPQDASPTASQAASVVNAVFPHTLDSYERNLHIRTRGLGAIGSAAFAVFDAMRNQTSS